MLYAVVAEDIENSADLRAQYSDAHRSRLTTLVEQGRLCVAGPCPQIDAAELSNAGVSGSIIIAEFDSLEDATEWANEDPFLIHGVYLKVSVKPFKKVFP